MGGGARGRSLDYQGLVLVFVLTLVLPVTGSVVVFWTVVVDAGIAGSPVVTVVLAATGAAGSAVVVTVVDAGAAGSAVVVTVVEAGGTVVPVVATVVWVVPVTGSGVEVVVVVVCAIAADASVIAAPIMRIRIFTLLVVVPAQERNATRAVRCLNPRFRRRRRDDGGES
jgi:hypothetical protein